MSWFRKSQPAAPRAGEARAKPKVVEPPTLPELPAAVGGVGHLDEPDGPDVTFSEAEQAVSARVLERLSGEELRLPHLPATHLRLMDLVGNPECDIGEVGRVISEDVVLTATLLRTANSVMFGGTREIDSVRGAVSRIGLRGLRSTLYMQSLKSVMYRPPGLGGEADEVWRQSCASALFSRTLATFTGRDPERSFVLGLLHDVGRIPILRVLAEEMKGKPPRHELARSILLAGHEGVGSRLAELWNLPAELAAACGSHHGVVGSAPLMTDDHSEPPATGRDDSGEAPPVSEHDLAQAIGLVRLADKIDLALHGADTTRIEAILADTAGASAAGLREDRIHAAVSACIRAWGSWTAQTAAA